MLTFNLFKKTRIFCAQHVEEDAVIYDFSIGGYIVCARSMTELYSRARDLYAQQSRLHRPSYGVSLFCSGKLLNPSKSLEHYPLRRGVNELTWVRHLTVGGSYGVPEYESVRIERIVMTRKEISLEDIDVGKPYPSIRLLQADEEEDSQAKSFQTMMNIVMVKLNKRFAHLTQEIGEEQVDWIRCQTENVIQSIHWFHRADNLFMWASLVYKLFTGRSSTTALIKKWNSLFGSELQLEVGEGLSYLRRAFDATNEVSEYPIVKKFMKLFNFLLVQGVLSKLGLELNEEDYSRLEIRTMQAAFSSKKGMWIAAFDALLFLVERAHEFSETKDICVFLHSDAEYSKWSKECDRLVNLSTFVGNLEAHGTSYFAYVSDISDAIERGEAYSRYSASRIGVEALAFKAKLAKLRFIKATELTRRSAQSERKAPFGVLIHGSSSVAKSTMAKMMFYHYGKVFDLPTEDHFRFVRSPTDEYWSNFDSGKWCIQMDDIAFMKPTHCAEIDPTIKELLNVVNNVPFCPPQAELENKGKTPVKAALVTATTNALDLNAFEYFHCPLAVRRRLPYVVNVTPKQEYLHSNGRFIDPSKLPKEQDGYPDFWDIEVMEIVPVVEGNVERATLRVIKVYSCVEDFLAHFIATARAHDANQQKSMACDGYMLNLKICKTCGRSRTCACSALQVEDDEEQEFIPYTWVDDSISWSVWAQDWLNWCITMYGSFMFWYFTLSWHLYLTRQMAKHRATRFVAYKVILALTPECVQLPMLGSLNSIPIAPPKWRRMAMAAQAVVGIIAVGSTMYAASRILRKEEPVCETRDEKVDSGPPVEEVVEVEADHTELDERLQGNVFGTTEDQMIKEERQNVWYNPTVELSRFDLPVASTSINSASNAEVRDLFENNCVRVELVIRKGDLVRRRNMCGVFVRGHFLMVNAHLFPPEFISGEVTIVTGSGLGINTNVTFTLYKKEIESIPEKDLSMFMVTALPPRKDITKFWAQDLTQISRILRLKRNKTGTLEMAEIFGVSYFPNCTFQEGETQLECGLYRGTLEYESTNGDCGSLAVAMTPRGRAIVGIHALGIDRSVGEIQVNKSDVDTLVTALDTKGLISLQVEGGGEPDLCLESKVTTVNPLHHKSMTRYLPEAKLQVYGTLSGFRPRPKSCVRKTPLADEMCEHFGVEIAHGKPVMIGWQPWRVNLTEMVKPFCGYDRTVFEECAKQYMEDAISELPEDWEKEMVFLSLEASINGLPGVRYIDGINRNSSMGFPWNKTKREFLIEAKTETHPEGVTFDEETLSRAAAIEVKYREGKRANPVFSAHLKDEAVTFAKMASGKTRVFTGAPVDWSIVVRKHLLPFVRLLQKNKFAFEAGPGTVTQSVEWQYIRDYIVIFGEDRIVAGDYGKFDKRMTADLILMAFKVIAAIYKRAGFSDEECRIIMCIGEDTAFSWCNFVGDLVAFLGTNPSGHPLTVIINSIVNSLYMRYCFYQLNPDENKRLAFREFVHLFTYGDDNIMGVSRDVGWFNHTAIQAELKTIGVEYTMADKLAVSVPFINISEVSFLKRKWRFDEDIQEWLCPLEEESIHKSLTVWTPSGTLDDYSQMCAVITSANNEFFFYGRVVFEKHHAFFREILSREPYSLCKAADLPTWAQLVDRYQRASAELAKEYGRSYAPWKGLAAQPLEN